MFRRVSFIALLVLFVVGSVAPATAQPLNSAEVIVRLEGGRVESRRVTFSEASISGLEALRRSGLALEESGGLVCRVDRSGCPASDCFCALPLYWSYYHLKNGSWEYATTGAGTYQVTNGAVEGWSWGEVAPSAVPAAATQAALNWLRGQQQPDGSFGNVGGTLDSLLAAGAAYEEIDDWRTSRNRTMIDYLAAASPSYAATGAREMGKLALGLAAADLDPRNFVKQDLVISLTTVYDPQSGVFRGEFGPTNWDQAFGMLGWAAAGETIPVTATRALAQRRNFDGGWGFSAGSPSAVDSTGLALQALVAGGTPVTATEVVSGVQYLRSLQNLDGGFPADSTAPADPINVRQPSNANSTAFAVQGLLAADVDPLRVTPTISGTTPISFLLALQQPDGGLRWRPTDSASNVLATQQAIPALMGKTFPIRSRAVALRKALEWVKTQQLPGGDFVGFSAKDTGSTIDAVLGIRAAGRDPQSFKSSAGKTPLDYLAVEGLAYAAKGASQTGKLLLGVVAAGGNPRSIGGADLVISTTNRYNGTTGAFGPSTYDQLYSILGLVAAGQTVPVSATRHLESIASPGGGWGFTANDANPDVDTTGFALQALAAAGVPKESKAVQDAIAFLRKVQNPDGGFPGFNGSSSANSTGLALQGLAAYGEEGRSLGWVGIGGATPVEALLALQSPEGGFAGFSGPNDPLATYQALGGLAGAALPTRATQVVYLPIVIK